MTLYSQYPVARTRQIVGDILAVALIALSVVLAVVVHSVVAGLATIGTQLNSAGSGFSRSLSDAAGRLAGVPLIGRNIRAPFDSASNSGKALAIAGSTVEQLVGVVATVLAIVIVAAVVIVVIRYWGIRRVVFARSATIASDLSKTSAGRELLALRALTRRDPRVLLTIDADPVAGWRRGDHRVVSSLAAVALRDAGIRPAG